MKRVSCFLTLVALCLLMALPVCADAIWEPDDSFYISHQQECENVNRQYRIAGFDGEVSVYDRPEGSILTSLDNGETATVQYVWHGPIDWGYTAGFHGWIPMGDLSLIYDGLSFMQDHGSEVAAVSEVPVAFSQAVLYTYPGGRVAGTLQEEAAYLPFSQAFSWLFTDSAGRRWGYVSYYMGARNAWVCLDDPMNEHLDSAVLEPEPSQAQQQGAPSYVPDGSGVSVPASAASLVSGVVLLTLILIKFLFP